MDSDKLLNLATSLGCLLAESGAEISRVEESVYRLLQAYGGEDAQVFAIPSCLIVSLRASDGHPVTRMRRIPPHGTDIELLERCNELCRTLCRTVPPLEQAQELMLRYTGLALSAAQGVGLDSLRYLSEYNAYYRVGGEAEAAYCRILSGWHTADGLTVLQYDGGTVTLRQLDGRWVFVSNVPGRSA